MEFCLRKILTYRLEYAIKYQVENGHFDIGCVAQYHQNTRERLHYLIIDDKMKQTLEKIVNKVKKSIGKAVAVTTIPLMFAGGVKANDFLDIWNVSWDIGKGQEIKMIENQGTGEYLRGPARALRIYGWGKNGPNLEDHEISPIGIDPNKTYLLEFRLEAETCPSDVNNCIYINHWLTDPLDPAKRNFFMRQDPNSPRKGTSEEDPNVYDLIDLTDYFTQNAQIQLPNITSSTPRTPSIYDKWQKVIANYADISSKISDVNLPDGKVDFKDYAVITSNFGRTDCNSTNKWCDYADLDRNGDVNNLDLRSFNGQWLCDPNTIR